MLFRSQKQIQNAVDRLRVDGGFQALQPAVHAQSIYRVLYLLLTRTLAWFAVLYLAAGALVVLSRRAEPEFQS